MKLYYFGKKNELSSDEIELVRRIGFTQTIDIIPLPQAGTTDGAVAKRREAENIVSKLKPDDFVVVLDEHGKQMDSPTFAQFMKQGFEENRSFVFIVGGAYGLGEKVLERAHQKISLGSMVWTKSLARHMTLEQIYRALEIMGGSQFHKE